MKFKNYFLQTLRQLRQQRVDARNLSRAKKMGIPSMSDDYHAIVPPPSADVDMDGYVGGGATLHEMSALGQNPMTILEKMNALSMAETFAKKIRVDASADYFYKLWQQNGLQALADANRKRVDNNKDPLQFSDDVTTSMLQAYFLDVINVYYRGLRCLFTTAHIDWEAQSSFLHTLATSSDAYERGYIMNPSTLSNMAPSASPINWDSRINGELIEKGIRHKNPFVFITHGVTWETFLDPGMRNPRHVQEAKDAKIGAQCSYNRFGNYPVKPGGNEVLTLLDSGYKLCPNLTGVAQLAHMGFVLIPAPGGCRVNTRFKDNAGSFTDRHLERLQEFMGSLNVS